MGSPVFPKTFEEPGPFFVPHLELDGIQSEAGYLWLTFKNTQKPKKPEHMEFRLTVEIPGFANSAKTFFSVSDTVTLRIPFPAKKSFVIRCGLDFKRLKIPSSVYEFVYTPGEKETPRRKEKVVYLSGSSPRIITPARIIRLCEKEVGFEVKADRTRRTRVRITLISPFNFSELNWYGSYSQKVWIYHGQNCLLERELVDGRNIFEFDLDTSSAREETIPLMMKFRYHLLFWTAHLKKLAAILEKIEVESF